MTLGIRDLVSSGLYRRDPIVTDFTFATTLVTLFGPHRKNHCSRSKLVKILRIFCLELIKLFRTARNDPEQRPRILDRAQHHYDFIIVGKCLLLSLKIFYRTVSCDCEATHIPFNFDFWQVRKFCFWKQLLTSDDPKNKQYTGKKEVVKDTYNLFVASVSSGCVWPINGLQTLWPLLIVTVTGIQD